MGIPSKQRITPIIFQENICSIIDIPLGLPVGDLFDPSAQPIVAVRARERRRRIPGHEVFDLHQSIFRVIRVLAVVPRGEERYPREIPVVVVLVAVRGIGGELVAGIDHRAVGRAIADRIIGKGLARRRQRVTRAGQPIEWIIAEALRASSVRQAGPIPHRVIDVVRLIDLAAGGRELVEDIRDLTGGIVT